MNTLAAVPIHTKEEVTKPGWVVGMADGMRIFITANHMFQDETSVVFHNGPDRPDLKSYQDLVVQVEKIHMAWVMPNIEALRVLLVPPDGDEEEDDGTED